MADESYSFSTARTRLEEIVSQVRKKDTSLEKSLDLLEEGVRLANACTELIDHQDWVGSATPAEASAEPAEAEAAASPADGAEASDADPDESIVIEGVAVVEDVLVEDEDGNFVAEVIEITEYEPASDFEDADDAWADESPAGNPDEPDDPSADEG